MVIVTRITDVVVRDMTPRDLPEVDSIEIDVFPCPWSLSAFWSEIENPLAWTRVATTEEGGVVGYLVARFYGDLWHVMDLAVCASAHRTGVGSRLLDDLLARVAADTRSAADAHVQQGAQDVTLEVRPSNQPAIALYRSRDFEEVGRRRRYYEDTGEDAIIMLRSSVRSR